MRIGNILNKLKGAMQTMRDGKEFDKAVWEQNALSSEMETAIDLWGRMYRDEAPWLKKAAPGDPAAVSSLGLPSFIASEKARMAVLELKTKISDPNVADKSGDMEHAVRAAYLDEQYQTLQKDIRRQLEYGIAKGGLVIKPYVQESGESYVFGFDYVQADDFKPIAFDASGNMTEAVFFQRKAEKNIVYTKAERHILEGNTVTVQNKAYKLTKQTGSKANGGMGTEIPLSTVAEWSALEPETTITGVDRLLFAYFKMPDANTVDEYSPLGVSGYSRAVDLIRKADEQYSRLLWEFEGGEMAVDVDRDALKFTEAPDGRYHTMLPRSQERLFRRVDLNSEDSYHVFAPPLRDASYLNGLQSILMRIEDVCALSRGTLVDVSAEARTATELKILKQRSYAANADIQAALESALRDVVYIMDVYCDLYKIQPKGEYEVSFEWDDSILVDVDTELSHRIILMQNGICGKVETRMWYTGETREQAEQALREIFEEDRRFALENVEEEAGGEMFD